MAIQQAEADQLLAEFLQQREITKYKATRKQAKAEKPMPLVKAEFMPDNSRIKRQSRGMQTMFDDRIRQSLEFGLLDMAALLMVQEFRIIERKLVDADRGVWFVDGYQDVKTSVGCVYTVVNIDADEIIESSKTPRPPHFGERVELVNVPVRSVSNNTLTTGKQENMQWKSRRMPRRVSNQ